MRSTPFKFASPGNVIHVQVHVIIISCCFSFDTIGHKRSRTRNLEEENQYIREQISSANIRVSSQSSESYSAY